MHELEEKILDIVKYVLQGAEEMGGPEGIQYIELMQAVSKEANDRIANYRENRKNEVILKAQNGLKDVSDKLQKFVYLDFDPILILETIDIHRMQLLKIQDAFIQSTLGDISK